MRIKKMPRYFFDVNDGNSFTADADGLEFGTREDIRRAALAALPDMAREALPLRDSDAMWVRVRDADGRDIYRVTMSLNEEWFD
jgi:hypothetical protein